MNLGGFNISAAFIQRPIATTLLTLGVAKWLRNRCLDIFLAQS